MRLVLSLVFLFGGAALATVSYFALAAPIGTPIDESFSNPRVDFAPSLFVIGVSIALIAAVVYELLPNRPNE
jgi:hypothetical protein